MRSAFISTTIALIAVCLAGCASSTVHIADVTNDPRFAGTYRPGEVWRLKRDGFLVYSRDQGLELSAISEPDAIQVYAGSVVRIERLGYLFNSEHPPVASGPTEVVLAYGTLTDAKGQKWEVAVLPALRSGRRVEGTSLFVYPPDRELLEPAS